MKIDIPDPCSEKWENMQPVKQGAFCSVCSKTVIDFTQQTAAGIREFFSPKDNSERVCARMSRLQLLELSFDDFFSRFRYWSFARRAGLIVFFVFGLTLFSCGSDTLEGEVERVGKVAAVHDTISASVQSMGDSVADSSMSEQQQVSLAADTPVKKVNKAGQDDHTLKPENQGHPPPLPLAPQYKGGRQQMEKIIASNLKYPEEARKNNIEGSVYVVFKVTADGKIKEVKAQNSLGYGCDEEAVRVVMLLKDWNPGRRGGRPEEMESMVEIKFKK